MASWESAPAIMSGVDTLGKPAGAADQLGRRRVRVLQSVPEPHERTNPFITQLARSLPDEVEITWFTWRAALFSRYDVVHAHWPELALRAPRPLARAAQHLLFTLWLVRLTVWSIPVVRTVHNTSPHEAGPAFEQWLTRWFDARTVTWMRMTDATPTPSGKRASTIPHGHYVDWFAAHPKPAKVPGRILYFGLIRRYKGVPELLEAFAELPPDRGHSLRVVGRSEDDASRSLVEKAQASDPRITALLTYVDDATLAREVGEAQVVVLPFQRMLNSGSMLLALSLAAPVLVPRSAGTSALSDEVGAGWVLCYDAPLGAAELAWALEATAKTALPAAPPDLSARDWPGLGEQLYSEYLEATEGD